MAQNIALPLRRVYSSWHKISPFLYDEYTRHGTKYRPFFTTSILVVAYFLRYILGIYNFYDFYNWLTG